MANSIDVIALARQAGLCMVDCHFLDLDPYEDLFSTLAGYPTEQERSDYLALAKEEDGRRRERLHQLELFAALVLRAGRDLVESTAERWQEEDYVIWTGAIKAAALLEIEALVLEHANQPEQA